MDKSAVSSNLTGSKPGPKEPTASSDAAGRDLASEQNMESALENSGENVEESADVELEADEPDETSEEGEVEPRREGDPGPGYICLEGDEPAEPAEGGKVKQISERKQEANRRNAQLSTGPKTDRGKSTSRLNSLKHGLLARAIPVQDLPDYWAREEEDLGALLSDLWSELRPEGSVEELLVERIACISFQLSRVYRFHRASICIAVKKEHCNSTLSFSSWTDELSRSKFEQYLLPDEIALGKIVRYESMLDRELNRCLDRLDRLQQRRRANGFRGSEAA
jgi:hypothetical protein